VFRRSLGLLTRREGSGAQQEPPISRNLFLGCCLLELKFGGWFFVWRVYNLVFEVWGV
jgi:hypothetical protein